MASQPSRRSLTFALCSGYFLVLLDVTVVNVALPRIDSALTAGSTGLAWIVDAYAIPLAALLLAAGSIGDRIGHRRVVLLGLSAFGAGSVACALAPTIDALIAARTVQGIGAATALPGTLALLVQQAPDDRTRGRLVGLWAAIGGAALPAGPVIGGLLVQAAGWRAVFWLGVPVILLALIPVLRLPIDDDRGGHRGPDSPRTVNWLSAALLAVGLGCAVTAIMEVSARPLAAALLAVGAVGSLVMLRSVERRSSCPLLPVPAGSRRLLGAACLVAGVMNLCALGSLFLLTQVFQDVHGRSPLGAGLLTLPALLPLPLLGTPASRLVSRIGAWRTSAFGLFLGAVGLSGMAMSIDGAPVALGIALLVWGSGLGILTPAVVTAALRAVPDLPGLASGASNTSRQTGGALGIALFAALVGSSGTPSFSSHTAGLFLGSGAGFVVAAMLCLHWARSPSHS